MNAEIDRPTSHPHPSSTGYIRRGMLHRQHWIVPLNSIQFLQWSRTSDIENTLVFFLESPVWSDHPARSHCTLFYYCGDLV